MVDMMDACVRYEEAAYEKFCRCFEALGTMYAPPELDLFNGRVDDYMDALQNACDVLHDMCTNRTEQVVLDAIEELDAMTHELQVIAYSSSRKVRKIQSEEDDALVRQALALARKDD